MRPIRPNCPHPEKAGHATLDAAFRQLESLERAGKGDGKTWPYWCECGTMHLGHNARARRSMKAKYEAWLLVREPIHDGYTTNQADINRRIKRSLKRRRT